MKIALAQLNYTVGDFRGNLKKMIEAAQQANRDGARLLVLSELAVCGYPPHDLLERRSFVEDCMETIEALAAHVPPKMGVLVGGPELNPGPEGKLLYNSAYFLEGGAIRQIFRKTLLPTYDIFDEYRYFEPNRSFDILEFQGHRLAISICEDLWDEQPFESDFSRSRLYKTRPLDELMKKNPELIINLAASPFSHRKMDVKESTFCNKAKKHGLPVLYCNQSGAQTELIFEGGSLAIDSKGRIVERLPLFREETRTIDSTRLTEASGKPAAKREERIPAMAKALVCGIRDYFRKSGFDKATLGLSGGIDSAVSLVLAARALGPGNLHALLMPSPYSSQHSIDDSVELANRLGVEYSIIPIEESFNAFRNSLKPLFGDRAEDLTEENIQARIRGTLLMALSNKMGHILLNTSNKSEIAIGYGTLYGDMNGGLSVLGDVYKLDVYNLARHFNEEFSIVPENIIVKAPSAELRPDQKDSDSLPPYELLDEILERYIEWQRPKEEIIAQGYESAMVKRIISLVDQSEYKRYQAPPILRVSSKAFGPGRRLPLVAKY